MMRNILHSHVPEPETLPGGNERGEAPTITAERELRRRRRLAWARNEREGAVRDDRDHRAPATSEVQASTLSGPRWTVDVGVVERHRIVRGWTRLELAVAAHVDPKTLRDLLGQRRRPNLGTVQAICVALGLTLSDVIQFA